MIALHILIYLLAAIGFGVVLAVLWCVIFVPVNAHENFESSDYTKSH